VVQRPDNIAMPLPKGLAGAAAKVAVTKMMMRGWLQEVDANLRQREQRWRETGGGHGATLVVTEAGLLAIGIEQMVVKELAVISEGASETHAPKPPTQYVGTKQSMLIAMLPSARRCHDGGDHGRHRLASA
jgi:hypothetical protein